MKKLIKLFDLDFIVASIIVTAFTLAYFPEWALINGYVIFRIVFVLIIVFIYAVMKQCYHLQKNISRLVILFLCIWYFHSQAISTLNIANNIAQVNPSQNLLVKIIKIFKQSHYQTALAEITSPTNLSNYRIYLNWKSENKIKVGENWATKVKIRPISSRLNVGGFDKQKWYLSQGIVAYGVVKSAVKKKDSFSWRENKLNLALEKTQGLLSQGLLMALGFGERAWLKQDTWQAYQETNTAHLIAISGLHIGLAMLFGFLFARLLQFFLPTQKITPIFPISLGILFACFYAYLAGFSITTLRAILALVVIYFFQLNRLYCTVWQLFSRVIAILCLIDPMMLLSSSFWLSASAVFCLIIWYQFFPLSLLQWKNQSITYALGNKMGYFLGLLHLQLGLLWLFTPIQLFLFQGVSTLSFIANLIVVPLFSLCIVPIILFAVFSNGLGHSWEIANWLLIKINKIIFLFKDHWITIENNTLYLISIVLIVLFFIFIYGIYFGYKKELQNNTLDFSTKKFPLSLNENRHLPLKAWRLIKKIGIASIVFFIGYFINISFNHPHWRLETIDVGQGLATLIVKDKRAILYDTGAGWKTGSMAKSEIIPYLQREGIILEKLFISHDDNDHSGGVKDILAIYPNIEIITTSTKNYFKKPLKFNRTFCKKGQQWQWYGLSLVALSPKKIVKRSKNMDSCVLLVTDNQHQVLLTGDATLEIEKNILSLVGKIDVLQVGHHGSKTSTSQFFIDHIQPKVALISSGRWNPWHFPHKKVIQNLQRQHSQIFNTAHSGQINILFYKNGFKIEQARHKFSPWFSGLIGINNDLRLQ